MQPDGFPDFLDTLTLLFQLCSKVPDILLLDWENRLCMFSLYDLSIKLRFHGRMENPRFDCFESVPAGYLIPCTSFAHKRHHFVAALSAAYQFSSSWMNIVSSVISLGSSSIVDSRDDGPSGVGSVFTKFCHIFYIIGY